MSSFDISGKTILITGASSGIGRACAIKFAEAGATVVATGRDTSKLDSLKSEMSGDKHVFVAADLTKLDDIKALMAAIPAIDGLVHCAGVAVRIPIKFSTDDQIASVINANYISSINLTREIMKTRKVNAGGSLLFISSVSANLASAGHFAYASTKAAIVSFAREMAVEFAPRKIRSNSVSPGVVETPMVQEFFAANPDLKTADEKKYLLGYGKPESIADIAQFFMSDASKWITGSNLVADGGYSCFK